MMKKSLRMKKKQAMILLPEDKETDMEITSKDLALKAAEILDSKKAMDIKVLEIKELTSICDYFVICSGTSSPHIKSLCDEMGIKLSELYDIKAREEGYNAANWLLMDYGNVVIHIFNKESREFYGLERLWADAPSQDLSFLEGQN